MCQFPLRGQEPDLASFPCLSPHLQEAIQDGSLIHSIYRGVRLAFYEYGFEQTKQNQGEPTYYVCAFDFTITCFSQLYPNLMKQRKGFRVKRRWNYFPIIKARKSSFLQPSNEGVLRVQIRAQMQFQLIWLQLRVKRRIKQLESWNSLLDHSSSQTPFSNKQDNQGD